MATTYETNTKTEDLLAQLYEQLRPEMTMQEVAFAEDRFGELKSLIDVDSEYVTECATELHTHLEAIAQAVSPAKL